MTAGDWLFMVALCNRADHYIFALWFPLLSCFPRLISAVADCMSATKATWRFLVRVSDAGLKRAAHGSLEMQDPKKSTKICHLGTIAQLCRAISSQLRHVSTSGNKSSSVAEMGDRCHNRHGPKRGGGLLCLFRR